METHLMLGRMDVHIHLMGIDLQIQHKRRLLIGAQLVFTGLADSMIDQPVAHHPAVDVTVLNFRQRRGGMERIGNPAAQGQIAMLPLDRQRMFEKSGAANGSQPPLPLAILRHCPILSYHLTVMVEVNGDVEARQRNAAHHLVNVAELGFFGAHKFAPRRRVVEQIEDFQGGADRVRRRLHRYRLIAAFGISLPGFLLLRRARSQR